MVIHRREMRPTLARLCRILTKSEALKPVEPAPAELPAPPTDSAEAPSSASPA
jgi:acetyl-CoA carboxylase carboxyl transferase subunit beta